jgi:hypothetical protein
MNTRFNLFCATIPFAQLIVLAQGTLTFDNRNLTDPITGSRYEAPVSLPDGSAAAGDAFTAGLFLVQPGSLSLLATTTFRTGAGAGFFLPPLSVVSVPGIPSGSAATFRARVWETAAGSFENAVAGRMLHGEFPTGDPENNLFVPALGPSLPTGVLPPDMSGIRPLTLQVPEPAFVALLALGGTMFAVARRRFPLP